MQPAFSHEQPMSNQNDMTKVRRNEKANSNFSTENLILQTENNYPFIQRDISWLSFNYRVLQEAKDPTVPLFERIKFLAIYSSNLDEFFRVRMVTTATCSA